MIDHVALKVTPAQAEACAGFYELLGFARVEPPAGLGARAIWLTRSGTTVHLLHTDNDGVASDSSEPGGGHFAVVIDQYDATLGALAAAGVTIDERTPHWGSPRCYVSDPAGNKVELMAFAPGA